MIKRKKYLDDIRPFYDEDLIKVIAGIRRRGKSILLEQIVEELSVNVDKEHIIYINFEDVDYLDIKDFKDLNNYIVNLIKDDKKYYLLFDEIQNIKEWERTINSLKATKNVSLFITGSNSDLLSGDLSTYLSGRYVSFRMQPFTFKEVCELKGTDDYENIFLDYIKWEGMPQRFRFNGERQLRTYLSDLGLGRIMNTSKKEQFGAYVENIVYNELIYREYDVKIGTMENREIDFIALKDGNKEYYQVCYVLGDNENVIDREFSAFDNVRDNYPKYVISTDKFDMLQDGIIHKNIIDWLLEK